MVGVYTIEECSSILIYDTVQYMGLCVYHILVSQGIDNIGYVSILSMGKVCIILSLGATRSHEFTYKGFLY